MNPPDDAEAAPEARRKPLSLTQARTILIAITCFILLLAATGIHELQVGQKTPAFFSCLAAAVSLLQLPLYLHLYRQVKKGKEVILRPLPLSALHQSPRVPFWVSIIFISLLTLLVAAASIMFLSVFASIKSPTSKLIIVGVNLFFWLVTAFVWYCALKTEHRRKEIQPIWEQTEGVWPPAPTLGSRTEDGD